MKKTFFFAAMLAIAASCTVYEIESVKGTTAPEITASYESNGTKTAITTDDEGVGTIWWKPADEINVFYGTVSTHYTSKNTENATTVAFGTTDIIGSTESAQESIWGLYPYDGDAVCDGESVTTTIPATQKAVAGTFDDDIFTSLAHSTSTTMTFYNVLGGIKFSLSRDDIQTITFKGNNNEDIAGKVSLSMDANGKPVAEITEGEKAITLTPKEGTTFASNTNYYIVLLPTVLSNGFTMTFETETALGTFEYTAKSIEIKRSVFSKKENIDSYATFDEPEPVVPDGTLPGMFSVSATKKVFFSKGNLYWDGDSFELETNQYDFLNSWSASHVSLFFWSKTASVAYAGTFSDESASIDDVFFTNATEETAKADFTVNGVTGKYRTLSDSEWGYLFNRRTMENNKPSYSDAVGGVSIGGITYEGVFLYPDNYNGEEISGTMTWNQINEAGIAFLPNHGEGYWDYWTSSSDSWLRTVMSEAPYSSFRWRYNGAGFGDYFDSCSGRYSVRLVTDVK